MVRSPRYAAALEASKRAAIRARRAGPAEIVSAALWKKGLTHHLANRGRLIRIPFSGPLGRKNLKTGERGEKLQVAQTAKDLVRGLKLPPTHRVRVEEKWGSRDLREVHIKFIAELLQSRESRK